MRLQTIRRQTAAWLPLLVLPTLAVWWTPETWPRWGLMWLLAAALFAGCKWLTWRSAQAGTASWRRHVGYLLAWPGMDAPAFLGPLLPARRQVALRSWLFALGKMLLGILIIGGIYPALPDWLRGWIGMVGIVLTLHCGLFHLLSLIWQRQGVDAKPIMNWPLLACSVSEFWGRRWNTAFRDLTYRFLFRPLTPRVGALAAILVGFLGSGLIHELVITVPARGGYGGPTAFFLIQAAALLLERSALGQRLGLTAGIRGWTWTLAVLALPVGWLFPPRFVQEIIVPFLDALVGYLK